MIRRLAVFLLASGLLLSLCMPFFCFPPLSQGLWFQVEMPLVILYCSASLCLIGALCLSRSHPHLFKHAFQHPIVLLFFLIACISALFTPLHPIPLLNLFGSSELGQGVFWFLSISALLMGMLLIKLTRLPRLLIVSVTLLVTFIVTFLTLWGKNFDLPRPYNFEDYLAFYGLFLLPILMIGFNWLDNKKLLGLGLSLSFLIILLSDNKAAIVLMLGFSLLLPLSSWILRRHQKFYGRLLIILTLVVPLFITSSIYYAGKGYESNYDTSKGRLFLTLKSRAQLTYIPLKLLSLNELPTWLTGVGWGMNDDEMIRLINSNWIYMGGDQEIRFEFLTARQPLHWHNEYIQALFSGGILCFLLTCLLGPLLLLTARSNTRYIAPLVTLLYCGLSTTWFQMPITLPLMAIAFAFLTKIKSAYWNFSPKALLVGGLLSVLALVYAIQDSLWVAAHFDGIQPPPSFSSAQETPITCGDRYVHFNRGGQSVFYTYGDYYDEVIALKPSHLNDAGPQENRDWLDCILKKQFATHQTQLHVYTNLLALYSRFLDPSLIHLIQEIPNFESNFESTFYQIWKIAPGRSDLAIPLFNYWLTTEQKHKAITLAEMLYKNNQKDPVALWYTGTFLISEHQDYQKGMRRLNHALDNHIEKLLQLDATTVKRIRDISSN